MSHFRDETGVNQSCFTCQHFQGVAGLKAACGHRRYAPAYELPEQGCQHWIYNATADQNIRTIEDWHVAASTAVPGFDEPDASIPWRAPLSGADLQRLQWAGQTPETIAMGWEIARLRHLIVRLHRALLRLAVGKWPIGVRVTLRRLADRLGEEPCVAENIQKSVTASESRRRK